MGYLVAALYHFADFSDYAAWREPLRQQCQVEHVKGTLLLAPEGINGTVAGPSAGIAKLLDTLRADARFAALEHKESTCATMPFHRLKVRLKKEIVTFGQPVDPRKTVGQYVSPRDWNALISNPDVTLVDTRNEYEVAVGKFAGAIDPQTADFREFADYVDRELDPARHRKVAMYCTGGIRCEKASAFLLQRGFEQVYHLKGGILKYFEEVPPEESSWQGECFVFDDRVALTHALQPGEHSLCYGCQRPIGPAERASPKYREGICCPHCHDQLSPARRASLEERQRQIRLARARGEQHVGDRD